MTAINQIYAGSRLTAAMLRAVAPLSAYKASNQGVSNTTLTFDNTLLLPVLANATYMWVCSIGYTGGTRGSSDLKFGWSVPSGAAINYRAGYVNTSGTLVAAYTSGTATQLAGTNGGSNLLDLFMFGSIAVSATAGNLQFEFAQNTSNGTATSVLTGAVLAAWQIQ